jgi:hypothetical protein
VSSGTIPVYKWTHVAVTRIHSSAPQGPPYIVTLYINGQFDSTSNQIPPIALSAPQFTPDRTRIGYWWPPWYQNPGCSLHGLIDEVKIFDCSLAPADGLGTNILKVGFEERVGATAYDRSGNNFAGAITNGEWEDVIDTNTPYPPGSWFCYKFSSTTIDYSANSILSTKDDLTIDCYIFWYGLNGVEKQTIAYCEDNYWFFIYKKQVGANDFRGRLGFEAGNGQSTQTSVIGTKNLVANQWNHITVTRAGDGTGPWSVKLYLNGVFDTSGVTETPTGGVNDISIGSALIPAQGGGTWTNYYSGDIDNLLFYDCVQMVQSDQLLYTFSRVEAGWVQDESVPNDNDGSLSNGAQVVMQGDSADSGYHLVLNKFNNQYVLIPYNANSGLTNIVGDLTIIARIKVSSMGSGTQTIISAEKCYSFYIVRNVGNNYATLGFSNNNVGVPVLGTTQIPLDVWTYVSVIRSGSGVGVGGTNLIRLYVNGILDTAGSETVAPSNVGTYCTYIGCDLNPGLVKIDYFNGEIDNIGIYRHMKTPHEDSDCDNMPDLYEMMRAAGSERTEGSNQYNLFEYNGRYALLVAPVRCNWEICLKYEITQLRYYLIANGWSDCDIIFLTTTDNNDDETFVVYDQNGEGNADTDASWIDGEAFHDNVGEAFDVMANGGSVTIKKDDNSDNTFDFAKCAPTDTVYIGLHDHGDVDWEETHYFCTYVYQDYWTIDYDDFWAAEDVYTEVADIGARYYIVELRCCYSGGWDSSFQGLFYGGIMMCQDDRPSTAWSYLSHSRFWGYQVGSYCWYDDDWQATIIYNEVGNMEPSNADGVYGLEPDRDALRGSPTNGIISVNEALYFANAVAYDIYGDIENPTWLWGAGTPDQLYL